MRLFVALDFPDAVRKSLGPGDKPTAATVPAVAGLVRELAEGVRSRRV